MWLLLVLLFASPVHAGVKLGEQTTYGRDVGFEHRLYYGSSGGADGQVEYICKAFSGTTGSDDTSSSVWQVQRLTYDSDGNVTEIEFAGDDDAFNQICANRTSLNYD